MTALGLDLVEAAKVAKRETFGEWYRDPWGWPELSSEFVQTLDLSVLAARRSGVSPLALAPSFHSFAFPKSYLGVRPAVVLDAPTRLLYTAAALSIARSTHEELPDWVYGWRFRDGVLGRDEWSGYVLSQEEVGSSSHAAKTDLNSFFASVNNTRLVERIVEKRGRDACSDVVRQVLASHAQLAGRSGLPQRSIGSSLLAHIAVEGIDDLLDARLQSGALTNARRWMDDITFEGSEEALYSTLHDIQERGRQNGLEINTSKTAVASGGEISEDLARERQRRIRIPRLDVERHDDYFDVFDVYIADSELGDAESKVLGSPTLASRSEVGLVLRSLAHYAAFGRLDEWLQVAKYLPHAADHLSRFVASAGNNWFFPPDTAAWFAGLQVDHWPHISWVRAQHSLAVASEDATDVVKTTWRQWLERSDSLQQVAAAAQRLTREPSSRVRSTIVGRIDETTDPLLTRVLALGLVAAGGDRRLVTQALRRHPSNQITLEYLSSHDWSLPFVSDDFDPSTSSD